MIFLHAMSQSQVQFISIFYFFWYLSHHDALEKHQVKLQNTTNMSRANQTARQTVSHPSIHPLGPFIHLSARFTSVQYPTMAGHTSMQLTWLLGVWKQGCIAINFGFTQTSFVFLSCYCSWCAYNTNLLFGLK
ncbi:unnamed protein product [Ceratitis capitata]|uniref:(Mediterranean fruit fly) hypothetical protein n=1 Tax=Ceratitis capitata TaxID=7213 RepID=A0A811UYL9_CERCA|nr:unnamed protein product [Ceratitis capitata]